VSKIKLSKKFIESSCKLALNEDLFPNGDITSGLISKKINCKAKIISNDIGMVGGLEFVKSTFKLIDNEINILVKKKDGAYVKKGDIIAIVSGKTKNILIGERVALNYLSHISGIASLTNKFIKTVKKKTKICCTRKTIPGLRVIQKYAVMLGGGTNHRFNLSDEFLIKDNHISTNNNIRAIVKKAITNKKRQKITIEVDNLKQLKEILGLRFDRVLLDNMSYKNIKIAVKMCKKKYETEASGGINLKNVKKISSTGVDRISLGCLTHSARSLDFKLEI
tara:strand:+ start:1272 stop:2108 length:837 start_codon:yes stop_codon:yes gene_type:complete